MDLAKRRRRRRRQQDRLPVSASLLLDARMDSDVGLLSHDLYHDIFAGDMKNRDAGSVRHIGIVPWLPESVAASENASWTVLPVKVAPNDDEFPSRSVRISTNAKALQSFMRTMRHLAPTKATSLKKDIPYEIRITDVVPLPFDTVYITLPADALRKHHEGQVQFGGGFVPQKHKAINGLVSNGQKGKVKIDEREMESSWRKAIKQAFTKEKLVHTGDALILPLPTHPISHIGAPPGKITACEPVNQGVMTEDTKVVVIKARDKKSSSIPSTKRAVSNGRRDIADVIIPEENEDTENETFYSAAEERGSLTPSSVEGTEEDANTDMSDTQSIISVATEDLSDDPEDLISLSAPMLPPQTSGILSGFAGATPRAGAGFHSANIGTPGSVHSGFSNSTVRGGPSRGRVFKSQGLLKRIPDDLLHPKPGSEDDEEARVFVDTSALVKIGCFSGDWVRIESAPEPNSGGFGFGTWPADAFQDTTATVKKWRPVRVYALPDILRPSGRSGPKIQTRQPGFGFNDTQSPPTVYAPPLLLANLEDSSHIRISSLSAQFQPQSISSSVISKPRLTSSSVPPVASEVNILKILTPITQDLRLQSIIFAELKNYFEGKKRILKTGDLIAIGIDELRGRMYHEPGKDTSHLHLSTIVGRETKPSAVAWFKVATVSSDDSNDESADWGGAAYLAPSSSKLVQKSNECARIPTTVDNTWQYYQGLKTIPATSGLRFGLFNSSGAPEPHVSEMRTRLRNLIAAATHPRAIEMGLPPVAILLTSTQRQIGKIFTVERTCDDLGLHCGEISPYGVVNPVGNSEAETEEIVRQRVKRLLTCGPENTVLLFRHIHAFTGDRMVSVLKDVLADSRIIVATTIEVDKMSEGVRSLFTHELEFRAPDEQERQGILHDIVDRQGVKLSSDVDLSSVALKTAAFVAGDLDGVVKRAVSAKDHRIKSIADDAAKQTNEPVTDFDVAIAGGAAISSVTKADFDAAVDAARKTFADAIGAPKIPNVTWGDVGGLSNVKDAVIETIQLPLQRPELFAKGMKKRSGILFYGPPGTGKTLLAKAIATEFSLNFFSVKGPELLNMYIGESEANVRRVFQRARDARPCVVFFDELDSVAPKRGNQGDSGGVMDRIVSQLLAELDGMSNGDEAGGVFVIGATNRPDLLDQALLRPGRFDKMLYLGISDTHDKQLKILEALTRKYVSRSNCYDFANMFLDSYCILLALLKEYQMLYLSHILVPIYTPYVLMPCSKP